MTKKLTPVGGMDKVLSLLSQSPIPEEAQLSGFHSCFYVFPRRNADRWEAKSSDTFKLVLKKKTLVTRKWTREQEDLSKIIEYRPATEHHFRYIMDALARMSEDALVNAARLFTLSPSALGHFYEGYVQRKVSADFEGTIVHYRDGVSTNSERLSFDNPQQLQLPKRVDATFEVREKTLYIPEPGMAAVDFVWYEAGVAWLFQVTVARRHDIKASGIRLCRQLFAGKTLRFVFAVPTKSHGEELCGANARAFRDFPRPEGEDDALEGDDLEDEAAGPGVRKRRHSESCAQPVAKIRQGGDAKSVAEAPPRLPHVAEEAMPINRKRPPPIGAEHYIVVDLLPIYLEHLQRLEEEWPARD